MAEPIVRANIMEMTMQTYHEKIAAYQEEIHELSVALQAVKTTYENTKHLVEQGQKQIALTTQECAGLQEEKEQVAARLESLEIQTAEALTKRDITTAQLTTIQASLETLEQHFYEVKTQHEKEVQALDTKKQAVIQEDDMLRSKFASLRRTIKDEELHLAALQKKSQAIEKDIMKSKKEMRSVYEQVDAKRTATLQHKEQLASYAAAITRFTKRS